MPTITVYIPQELFGALQWHVGLNKSKVVCDAFRAILGSKICPCDVCKHHRLQATVGVQVQKAIRQGKLTPLPCEVCKTQEKVEAHHDDYTEPLIVRWLCRTHHREVHKNNHWKDSPKMGRPKKKGGEENETMGE